MKLRLKENGATDKIPEYSELRELISFDYNLDIVENKEDTTNQQLIKITATNRLIVDCGIILDSEE